jgi:phage tail tape-measure protein
MASLGSLVADLRLNSASFVKGLDKASAQAKSDAAKMRRSLRSIDKEAKRVSRSMQQVSKSVSLFKAAVAGFAVGNALKGVIETSVEFQNLQSSLVTVTGGVDQAAAAFDQIKDFAATTPFDLQQVTGGFIKLKALGLDPSDKAMRSYGNTAAAMGKSLNQMVEAIADATTGEFERLKEFGIKSRTEGERVKFTFQGVTTEVGKNAHEIEEFLRGIGEVQFAGAMERQAKTIGGALSNLGDAFSVFQNEVGEGGFADAIAEVAKETANWLNTNQMLAREIGQNLAKAVKTLAEGARLLIDHWQEIAGILAGIVAMKFAGVVLGIVGAVLGWARAIWKAKSAMVALNVAMSANPIGLLASLIGIAVAALIAFKDETVIVGDKAISVSEAIMAAWNAVKKTINNSVLVIAGAGAFLNAVIKGRFDEAKAIADKTVTLFNKVNNNIKKGFEDSASSVEEYKRRLEEAKKVEEAMALFQAGASGESGVVLTAPGSGGGGKKGASGPSKDAVKAQDFRKGMVDDLKAEAKNLVLLQQSLSISTDAYDKQLSAIEALEEIRKSGHKLTQDEIGEILRLTETVRMSQKAFEDFKFSKETTDDLKRELEQQRELVDARKEGLSVYQEFEIRYRIQNDLLKKGRTASKEQIEAWVKMETQLIDLNKEMDKHIKAQEEIKSLTESMLTPMERYNKRIKELRDLLKEGLSVETYNRAVKKAGEDLDEALDKTDKVGEAAKELGMTFSSAFEDAMAGGKGLSEILNGLEQDIIRIVTRKLVTEPLTDWITDTIKTMGGPTAGQAGTARNQIPTGANMTAGRTGPAFPQLPPWIQPTVPMGASFESMSGPEVFDMSTLFNTGQAPGVGFDIGGLFNADPGGFDIGGMMSGFMGPIMGGLSSMLGGMFGGGGGMMGGGGPMGMLGMLGSQMGGSFLQNFSPLASLISGEGLFSFLGFAGGGRPPVGKFSVVGEKGPELFMPDTAGTVLPNDVLQGMGNNETQNFQIPVTIVANDPNAFRESEGQIASSMAVALQRARMRNL